MAIEKVSGNQRFQKGPHSIKGMSPKISMPYAFISRNYALKQGYAGQWERHHPFGDNDSKLSDWL
jgi:hypothetical protein